MQTLIIGSLILSILHSILFYGKHLGISVILFIIPVAIYVVYMLDKLGKIKSKKTLILLIPILLLSATYGIFNNNLFNFLNIFAIIGLFAIMSFGMVIQKQDIIFALKNIVPVMWGPVDYVKEPFKYIKSKIKTSKGEKENIKIIKKILKSLLLSSPLIFLVLALLSSADSVFADIVKNIFEGISKIYMIDTVINLIWRCVVVIAVFTYISAYVYNLIQEDSLIYEKAETIEKPEKDNFIILTLITVLNIIYLLFSIIQFSYLFAKNIPTNFDYATYARAGFFQLVAVSIINLILILVSTTNEKEVTKFTNKYKKIVNVVLCIFNGILLVSSFYRMHLYEAEYGYTTLRLLVYFGIATEAILLIITLYYIFNKKIRIFNLYFAVVVIMYVIINYANLDKVIAKRNVDRYFERSNIDIDYLLRELGTDAMPEIERLGRRTTDWNLQNRISKYYDDYVTHYLKQYNSFSEFNISRSKARKIVEED